MIIQVVIPPAKVPALRTAFRTAFAAEYREHPENFHAAFRRLLASGDPDDRDMAKRAAWGLGIDLGPFQPRRRPLATRSRRSRRNRRRSPRAIPTLPIEIGIALGLVRADGSVVG